MIELRRSTQSTTHALINGWNFGGIASVPELRQMASPEWAAECTRIADEIEGPARAALREAAESSERASERLRAAQAARELEPQTKRSISPRKDNES